MLNLLRIRILYYSNHYNTTDEIVSDAISKAKEFTDVKVDFLRISKNRSGNYFNWVVKVDNSLFAIFIPHFPIFLK